MRFVTIPRRPGARFAAGLATLAIVVGCGMGRRVAAQVPTAEAVPSATVAEVDAVPLAEASVRAVQAVGALQSMEESLQPAAAILEIQRGLPEIATQFATDEGQARKILRGEPTGDELAELYSAWSSRRRQLRGWRKLLDARSESLESALSELAGMETVWAKTEERAREEHVLDVTLARISEVRQLIRSTVEKTATRQRDVLRVQQKVGASYATAEALLGEVESARNLILTQILNRQGLPVWQWFGGLDAAGGVASAAGASFAKQAAAVRDYVTPRWNGVLLYILATLLAALALQRGRRRAAKWVEDEPALKSATEAFAVPYSMAVLLSLITVPWLNPLAPVALLQLIGCAALVPAVRLLRRILPPQLFIGVYGLSAFYVIDRFRSFLSASPAIASALFIVEMAAALFLASVVFSPVWINVLGWRPEDTKSRLLIGVRNLLLVLFPLAIAAMCLGYVRLGTLLGDGALRSGYAAILLFAISEALQGVWAYLLRSRLASKLRFVRNHRWLIHRRGSRVIIFLLLAVWAAATLDAFALLTPLASAISSVLGARFSQGNISVSLGDAVLFGGAVWAAFLLSRFIRFILEEDIYARVKLAHGASYALSTLFHYFIVIVGFLLGIALVGFDMSRFAIVAGALGVGIGFGLQNIVNNFVSGLILLFERPIQVGDAVEVGTLSGEVRRIGIRSSTIRTWDGADVVVPNGTLVADTVTNWTLSDRLKRIEIPVGVAYGSDPERVIAILTEVITRHPEIIPVPKPAVLFVAFGDSSLDFRVRAWTGQFDRWIALRSDLMLQIAAALRDAAIEIPFPQRDLHLRSIDGGAVEALARRPSGDEG